MKQMSTQGFVGLVAVATLGGATFASGCDTGDCTPGRQTSCACANGTTGFQVCGDDGAFGACQCQDAGPGGAGGGPSTTSGTPTSTTSGTGAMGGAGAAGGGGAGGCSGGLTPCGPVCADLQTDAKHCGKCDNPCPATASCKGAMCVCSDGKLACGTACVDAQTDAKNCGGCGHDCLGAACAAGVCAPEILGDKETAPFGVGVNAKHAYWTTAGTLNKVRRRALGGGSVEDVGDAVNGRDVVALGTVVYWSNHGFGVSDAGISFRAINGDGSLGTGPAAFAKDQPQGLWPLAVDGAPTTVFWANALSFEIKKAPVANPSLVTTLAFNQTPYDIAIDATHLYWSNNGTGEIRRVPLGGGAAQTLAAGQASPLGIALNASHVFWAVELSGEVRRVPLAGGAVEVVATGQSKPTGVAVDASHVYWTSFGNGTVSKAPYTGGGVTVLAAGHSQPYALAVDGSHVYWTNLAMEAPLAGSVLRVPK
jgi:hypothetical protein